MNAVIVLCSAWKQNTEGYLESRAGSSHSPPVHYPKSTLCHVKRIRKTQLAFPFLGISSVTPQTLPQHPPSQPGPAVGRAPNTPDGNPEELQRELPKLWGNSLLLQPSGSTSAKTRQANAEGSE